MVFELVCDKFIHYIEPLADFQVMKVKAEHPEKENWTELLPQRPNVSKFDLFPILYVRINLPMDIIMFFFCGSHYCVLYVRLW